MTKLSPDLQQIDSGSAKEGPRQFADTPTGSGKNRYASHIVNIERRSLGNIVFHVDDHSFTSTMPRASHWSIAWSDLMMTMFVLFLSMFVYQMAHQDFLQNKKPEIIGGDTTEALQTMDSSGAAFPFAPIHPGLPLITGGTVKKIEHVKIDSLDPDAVYPGEAGQGVEASSPLEKKQEAKSEQQTEDTMAAQPPSINPEKIGLLIETDQKISPPVAAKEPPTPTDAVLEPRPLSLEKPAATTGTVLEPRPLNLETPPPAPTDTFQEIYTMSKGALKTNNLDKFAAIDIVPDKTMRIILTGDLMFEVGESELSRQAKISLQKIGAIMQHTPYMINVVGHTDNLPMRSNRFKSNWDLSVTRASTVARFLIDEMGMDPNQFVVSGYSSYRPIVPNTTTENRAKNRRVEIIISKRLPPPLQATAENLK